jgi:uncharacterized RDD family membrane protein YckC
LDKRNGIALRYWHRHARADRRSPGLQQTPLMPTRRPPPRYRSAAKIAWQRLWARQFDNAICWWIASGAAALLGMASPLRGRSLLIALAIAPVLVGMLHLIYEVLMLTMFGTTIGKSVFGLRLETKDGKRPEFVRVCRRSIGAWLQGSYAYVLFPLATLYAWNKSHEDLRIKGVTAWDAHSETRVIGPLLPIWHVSAGAAMAIAAFGMVLTLQTSVRRDNTARMPANDPARSVAAGTIQPTPSSAASAASTPEGSVAAQTQNLQIGAIQSGNAVFPANSAQKSFAIAAPPGRPSASKSAEVLALWAEHTYPYLVADGAERRAMFAWMVAGTRVGLSRRAALALGIDTVVSGREGGSGVCWPTELPPDRIPKEPPGVPQAVVLGIRCDH